MVHRIKQMAGMSLIGLAILGLVGVWLAQQDRRPAPVRVEGRVHPDRRSALRAAADRFFQAPVVRQFEIRLEPEAEEALRSASRTFVRGTIRVDGHRLENVGVHLKGHGSFRRLEDKPSLHVKFDQFSPDQHYEGFNGFYLNNSVQDRTLFREIVARAVYREAGLPTPQVSHARVRLNGRNLGVYVLMEVLNRDFLAQYFERTDGNLYKPYLRDITTLPLPQESGRDWSGADLRELLAACEVEEASARWERLGRLLAVDSFITFVAVEMLVAHGDGYVLNRNNYFLYHDPKTGRFYIFTHDLDGAFKNPRLGLVPGWRGLLTRAVLQCPQGRWAYRRRVDRLFEEVFRLEKLQGCLQVAAQRLITNALNAAEAEEHRRNAEEMRRQLLDRHQYLTELLGQSTQQLLPEAGRPDAPRRWSHRASSGLPRFEATQQVLTIRLDGTPGAGEWNAAVFLPPGRYRFTGRVRLSGGRGDSTEISGWAWLKAGTQTSERLRQAGPAQWLAVEFSVTEGDKAVELVCGFQGRGGEAQFERESLHVQRLP